jgi:hypothetical protein
MYDKSKVLAGLIIFTGLFLSPIAYNWAVGDDVVEPVLSEKAKAAGQCVRETEWMRKNHMQLLNEWRDEAVRLDNREYVSPDNGKVYDISLNNTCMDCHSNYKEFCFRCHQAANVDPFCWDCHMNSKDLDELKSLRGIKGAK